MRSIKIPADIMQEMEFVEIPTTFPEINAAILDSENSLVEEVRVKGFRRLFNGTIALVLLIDEEGRLKDQPLNPRASVLYGLHVHGQPIVGDAYVVGTTSEDWVDVPEVISLDAVRNAIELCLTEPDEMFA